MEYEAMIYRAMTAGLCCFLLGIGEANAYPRFNGGCQYFEVDKTYEKSDLAFVGFLTETSANNSEPIDKSNPPQTILQENPPVRFSQNLKFHVLGIFKGEKQREDQSQWEQNVYGKFFTVRERYIGYSVSSFQIGNTYLISLSKKDNWGKDGWRIQECTPYESLGRGDGYFVMKEFENKHELKYQDKELTERPKIFPRTVNPNFGAERDATFK